MENGSIWGHGAYLGPDFSAEYLHTLSDDARMFLAFENYHMTYSGLNEKQQNVIDGAVRQLIKQNRYDSNRDELIFSKSEAISYKQQIEKWTNYFSNPTRSSGLPPKYISDLRELRQLTAFFAWTAWASVTNRPGESFSYTNNFPYDPDVGNTPTSDAILWSALSLITLLAALAFALFLFGRFDYFGWKGKGEHVHPQMLPGITTESQKATIKYFVIVAGLFLAQVLVGSAVAHYRAEPGTFYGIDLSQFFPSNILRTWHLQLAIFWIATAYVAGGLFLAPSLGGAEPKGQVKGINILFAALVIVSVGSLLGEMAGINQLFGQLWF
jgi:nitric oxide reductase subunit B